MHKRQRSNLLPPQSDNIQTNKKVKPANPEKDIKLRKNRQGTLVFSCPIFFTFTTHSSDADVRCSREGPAVPVEITAQHEAGIICRERRVKCRAKGSLEGSTVS
jgi:hypothetical protein